MKQGLSGQAGVLTQGETVGHTCNMVTHPPLKRDVAGRLAVLAHFSRRLQIGIKKITYHLLGLVHRVHHLGFGELFFQHLQHLGHGCRRLLAQSLALSFGEQLRYVIFPQAARIARYESVRKQRWGRPEALAAARRYNALAREHGMTPTQLALAFCYTKWQVASTIIGVTSVAQLDEDLNAWGTTLSPEVLKEIDAIRWELRDPAL